MAIFIHLPKAFDTVNHKILLDKLRYFGYNRYNFLVITDIICLQVT